MSIISKFTLRFLCLSPFFLNFFVLPWYQYSIFQTISPIFYFSADFHLYIQHTTFLSQLSVFGPLSPSSSPLQFHGPFFFPSFSSTKGGSCYINLLFFLIISWQQCRTLSDAVPTNAEAHALTMLLQTHCCTEFWSLVSSRFFFDFPSHLHVLQTTLYFHLCIICSGCHYHIRTRLRKWSAISTSTTLWSYNPYTHINTFCLSTPTHSLWPIPAGLRSE